MKILPVILAGGSGTRLWPLSRETYPKQFLKLVGEHSLLQETVLRSQSIKNLGPPLIISNESHYFLCLEQLQQINVAQNAVFMLEPFGRNTAPAIACAAHYMADKNDSAQQNAMLVMPSDHLITDKEKFKNAVDQALEAVLQDKLVTFGVVPTSPKTGYGYIKADNIQQSSHIYKVKQFIEKPDRKRAEDFIQQGNYYWNSGIFMFKPQVYLDELKNYSPEVYEITRHAYQESIQRPSQAYIYINRKIFDGCPNDSIDYAVMEKTKKAMIIPLKSDWNDLGCWTAVAESGELDEKNNVIQGSILAKETENCFLSSQGRLVATLGIKNQIVVSTADAVLVADKSYSQDVKHLVAQLKILNNDLTVHHKKVSRPWGHYESLANGKNFQVKHIVVKPQAKLSLQMHYHRAEHWVVVSGAAEVTNGDNIFLLETNQSTYIPKETKHRLSNPGTEPLHIIEVQTGEYLGEDDIIRFEDMYDRVEC